MASFKCLVALMAIAASRVKAQTVLRSEVVSTFMFTMYGDNTPWALGAPALTSLGAQQLYGAGSNMRARYVTGESDAADIFSTIRNISPYQLSNDEITILSSDSQYISASAQAFMQGLYPPLEGVFNSTYVSGQSMLANGTNVIAPLNGMQYPNIQTLSSYDLNSVWLAGSDSCPSYDSMAIAYYESPTFEAIEATTQTFYDGLVPSFLDGVFANSSVGYWDAYYIWDYLNYASIHNGTVANVLLPSDLTEARILATDWVFARNTNTSASGTSQGDQVGVIAGKTLAARILEAFYTTINTQGASDKMTLLFGSFEPMIAFATLAGILSEQNSVFYDLPQPGSSFVFELLALREADIGTYPETSDLYVQFLYQNGTDPNSELVAYPMFGNSPSQTRMSLADFIASMESIQVLNIETWCNACQSNSIFCPAFTNTDDSGTLGTSTHHGLNPVIAGVIGALVALVVAALLFALLLLIFGLRLRKTHSKRRSELNGFKGGEKLASDQDLTLAKGGAGASVTDGTAPPRGHERVGSWELREQAKEEEAQMAGMPGLTALPKARRPSYEDDEMNTNPYSKAVNPHDHV